MPQTEKIRILCFLSVFILAMLLLWSKPIEYGLDIKGGSYFTIFLNAEEYFLEQQEELRDQLVEKYQISKNQIDLVSEFDQNLYRIHVPTNKSESLLFLEERYPSWKIREQNDKMTTFVQDANYIQTRKTQLLESSISHLRRRIDVFGMKEALIQSKSNQEIILQIPGEEPDPELYKSILKQEKLKVQLIDQQDQSYGEVYLTGENIVDAFVSFSPQGKPEVSLELDAKGAESFFRLTNQNIGKDFAFIVDEKIESILNIDQAVSGKYVRIVFGSNDSKQVLEEASIMSQLLKSGSLPVSLEIASFRQVGPNLGQDSIERAKNAFLIALLATFLFLLVYYKIKGLFTCIVLLANFLLLLSCFALLDANLSIPGIAGMILTIGMSVDASILLYERWKEKPNLSSSELFASVRSALIDANVTTILAALVLLYFTDGPIRGFSISLALGILTTLFCIFFLLRPMLFIFSNFSKNVQLESSSS